MTLYSTTIVENNVEIESNDLSRESVNAFPCNDLYFIQPKVTLKINSTLYFLESSTVADQTYGGSCWS